MRTSRSSTSRREPTVPLRDGLSRSRIRPSHVAQKPHGASEPGGKRAPDLMDLQVIVTHAEVDRLLAKKTCERLFAYRQLQPWSPTTKKGIDW